MQLQSLAVLSLAVSYCAFSQTYSVSTYAGGGLPENAPGISLHLGVISAAAVDTAGNIFIALPDYHMVARLDASTGILTRVAGNGTAGYSGDNGPATSAQLSSPSGLAIDSAGNVYVADLGNNVVREVTNGMITTVAGNGTRGFSGDGGAATSAQLSGPHGIAVDAAANLFIADTGNLRIRKVSNGTITTMAGDGDPGVFPSRIGDGGPSTSGHLFLPLGVAVDSTGNVYIADTNNHCIRQVSRGVITTFASDWFPESIFVDSGGNLYVADGEVSKVVSGVMTTIAGTGTPGFSGDGGLAIEAQLNGASAVVVDASGNVYIADSKNMRLREISNGNINTVAGSGTDGFAVNGTATSVQLSGPMGIAMDGNGAVYIADTGANVVRKVAGGVITIVAGTGIAGFNGDNVPPTSAQLDGPSSVAVDSAGNLYIADTGNNIVRKVAGGVITTIAGTRIAGSAGDNGPATRAQLNSPSAVAVDTAGNLYITAHNDYTTLFGTGYVTKTIGQIREVSNGVITTVPSDTEFGYIGAITVDSSGNLYITAGSSIVELTNGVGTTVAGTGAAGFSGDNGPATSAQLSNPGGVFVDATGAIWIADTGNRRIRMVSNGVITTVASGADPAIAQWNTPQGILVDASGAVYFADTGDNRIRVLTPNLP